MDQTLLVGVLKTTRQLERLVLHGSIRIGLTTALADELFAMPRLKSLRVSRCGVAFETVCAAARATSPMEELDLSENHIFKSIDYHSLRTLFARLPRLTALHMQHDLHFDEETLVSALLGLPGKRELHLSKSRACAPQRHAAGNVALVWHTTDEHVWFCL